MDTFKPNICSWSGNWDGSLCRSVQDPYGYSSLGLMQAADKEEFLKAIGQDELFLNFDKQQMAMNCSHLFACLEETFSSLGWTIFMIFMMFRLLSRHQPCWICRMWSCTSSMPCLVWRPLSNPRLGFVDSSIERTNMNEQTNINGLFRRPEARGSLLQPDGQVVALREARVTYIEGRPFHAYWRIRLG